MRTATISAIAACSTIALLVTASPARADETQDQEFYRLLTDPDQTHPMTIWNFAEVRSEAIASCQRQDAGESPYRATTDLERPSGPYTFDDANNITSSAATIYCPWHNAPPPPEDGSWVNASAPVYPPPVYPRLAWYPLPPAYSGGGGS
jgi:predicted lipoprotein with Yx(FWY)xxD motif